MVLLCTHDHEAIKRFSVPLQWKKKKQLIFGQLMSIIIACCNAIMGKLAIPKMTLLAWWQLIATDVCFPRSHGETIIIAHVDKTVPTGFLLTYMQELSLEAQCMGEI